MAIQTQSDSVRARPSNSWRVAAFLRRAPLIVRTVIFTLISLRYLSDPVRAAAAVGIGFTSPDGITVARVGFAGFPLSFAILAFACLISARRRLAGLYMVLTVVSVVIAVRIFGILIDHSTHSTPLLAPEVVLLALSAIAVPLESARLRGEGSSGAPSFKSMSR